MAFFLLPREDNSWDTDDLRFDFETRDVLVDLLRVQMADMVANGTAAGAARLVEAFSAPTCLGSGGRNKLACGGKQDEYGQQYLSIGRFH